MKPKRWSDILRALTWAGLKGEIQIIYCWRERVLPFNEYVVDVHYIAVLPHLQQFNQEQTVFFWVAEQIRSDFVLETNQSLVSIRANFYLEIFDLYSRDKCKPEDKTSVISF